MRKVLVTGGAGFIGSNFIRYWLKQHPEDVIVNLDALTYAGNSQNLKDCAAHPSYHFVHGDICDSVIVNQLMADATHVVHFAAETHVDRSIKNPGAFVKTNVEGSLVLLQASVAHHIQHFHHISTDEVFGSLPLEGDAKFTDNSCYDPRSPYAASKAASDHLVRAYGETYGLPYTITNCSNNYGEFQFPEKLIPLAITNTIDGKNIPVYGDGLNVRDWLYVQDHCSAIEAVLMKGSKGRTYLVGGLLKDVANKEIALLILKAFGKGEECLSYIADRPGHDRKYSVDWSTIQKELDWQPSVTLEEGLHNTIEWYKTHEEWWRPLLEKNKQYFATQYTQ